MTQQYAKIGEYTPVEAMVVYAARFLANSDGKKADRDRFAPGGPNWPDALQPI